MYIYWCLSLSKFTLRFRKLMEQRAKFAQISADTIESSEAARKSSDSTQWVSSSFVSISGDVVTHDGMKGQKCVLWRTPFTPQERYINVRLVHASSAGIAIGVTSCRENGELGPPPLEHAPDSVLLFTDRLVGSLQAEGSLIPLADVARHDAMTPGSLVTLTLNCAERMLGFAVNGRNVRISGDYMRLDFRNLKPVVILYTRDDAIELSYVI